MKQINAAKSKKGSKLRKKILFMALSIAGVWCLVVGVYLFVFSNEYEDINILQSEKILGMFVYNFDEELKNYEELSYGLIIDDDVYDIMHRINFAQERYDKYTAQVQLYDILQIQTEKDEYIAAIYYIRNNGESIFIGTRAQRLSNETLKKILTDNPRDHKNIAWIPPDNDQQYAYLIRDIKKTEFDWNNAMGTILIAVDVNKIADNITGYTKAVDGYYLTNNEKLIRLGTLATVALPKNLAIPKRDTIVFKNNGEYWLTSSYFSQYNNWHYINAMNYSEIMHDIFNMVLLMTGILALALISTCIYGVGLSKTITAPIQALISKTHKAIKGEYQVDNIPMPKDQDEIGALAYDFNYMMESIDKLINQNLIREIEAKDYRYRMLQAQINPHLLYNTLEIIGWRASLNGDKETSRIVYALGKLLRNSITNTDTLISLSEELNILEYYIQIEKHRYEERLNIEIKIPEEHKSNSIPRLTLQPIVENAIKYGLESKIEGADIVVSSYEIDGKLHIRVKDDGIGIAPETLSALLTPDAVTKGSGIGLKNIYDRIRTKYGLEYGLEIHSTPKKGTCVVIILPLRDVRDITERS